MPIGSIFATVVAYVLIAILLLSLNLVSRWRWWIKGGAIIVTGLFFGGTYFAIASLLGWPTDAKVPDHFSLVATRVVEPDKFTGAPGAIFLWIEKLDENNVPEGVPRSFELGYTEQLAATVEQAQGMLDAGEPVEGNVTEDPVEDANDDPAAPGQGGEAADRNAYQAIEFNITFNDLPAVRLPDKGVL